MTKANVRVRVWAQAKGSYGTFNADLESNCCSNLMVEILLDFEQFNGKNVEPLGKNLGFYSCWT